MAHDVFISYSSKDKAVADAACATMEARGIRCWIAPRDVLPGKEWGGSLIDAINESRAMVLIFSANADQSQQIRREVTHAVEKNLFIVPFRIEDVTPSETMEYFLDVTHWLDALTPPVEAHLNNLADKVSLLLGQSPGQGDSATKPVETSPKSLLSTTRSDDKGKGGLSFLGNRKWVWIGAAAMVVVLTLAVGFYIRYRRSLNKDFQGEGALKTFTNKGYTEFPISMRLQRNNDGSLNGKYWYRTEMASGYIEVAGRMKNKKDFTLTVVANPNEIFDGSFISDNRIAGTWRKEDQSGEFTLAAIP